MAKKNKSKNSRTPQTESAETAPTGGGMHAARETIESIVIAFVLAFLFRTFEAEAFVIPTGSMSPSLQGQHKDVDCTECGYRFRTTASSEGDDRQRLIAQSRNPNLAMHQRQQLQRAIAGTEVVAGMCPMCRQTMAMRPDLPPGVPDYISQTDNPEQSSYPGDRILVNKFSYTNSDPQRWDVIVFKYPGNGEMNYIKRLVGLPNETLQIYQGDIFVRKNQEDADFQIERKPADKVRVMLQPVHDTDHDPSILYQAGWPLRWDATTPDGWQIETKPRKQTVEQKFRVAPTEQGEDSKVAWLRYHHRVPQDQDWSIARKFQQTETYSAIDKEQWLSKIRPELIRDFNPYNARRLRRDVARHGWPMPPNMYGMHWVSDLAVHCTVDVEQSQGELHLDLVEAGKHFFCRIDLSTGKATVGVEGMEDLSLTAETSVHSVGTHHLFFANVDDQLLLWVDETLIPLSADNPGLQYDAEKVFGGRKNALPSTSDTDPADLAPVGIGARGATLTVERLEVLRDIYYIATSWLEQEKMLDYPNPRSAQVLADGTRMPALDSIRQQFIDPAAWPRFSRRKKINFPIKENQLFVMGDNSPESQDCRLWASPNPHTGSKPGGAYLDRRLLIGKAVCVFWPHSWGGIPGASMLPGFPNFGDMRIVR